MAIKHAIILCGGKGSRLRPFTNIIPKPLMPVGDYSVLEIIVKQLKNFKFDKITLCIGYKGNLIKSFFGDGQNYGIKINYVSEKKPLGTMGPLNLIQNLENNFILMNGDILTDLNYSNFFLSHVNKKNFFTIASYIKSNKVDLGVLKIQNNVLIDFQEKPIQKFQVSMGVYAMNKSVLKYIKKKEPFGFDDLMLKMLKKNVEISIYKHYGSWLDIGSHKDYNKAIKLFSKKNNFYL